MNTTTKTNMNATNMIITRTDYERLRTEAHKDPRYLQSYLRMAEMQHSARRTMDFDSYKSLLSETTKKHKKFEEDLVKEIKQKESARGINPGAKPFVPKLASLFEGIVMENEELSPDHLAQIKYEEEMAAKCHCLTYMMQVECAQQIEKTGKCIYGPYKFF
jgi:hypothetical protein